MIGVDGDYAMRPELLAAALADDREQGLVPGIICATMGTTSSTACDPLRPIGTLAGAAGAWYHVDAAYGGTAAILPEIRPLLDGVELADSYVTNPHKWMMTSFDCSAHFVKDAALLQQVFSTHPEYLRTAHDPEVVNFRDWGIPLGRRFRALKLWFVLRSYGAEGLRTIYRRHLTMARQFASWVVDAPDWELLAPAPLGLVCCRHVPPALRDDAAALDRHNAELLARVNARGASFLTHTTLGGRYTIRVAIGALRTEERHVEALWEAMNDRR